MKNVNLLDYIYPPRCAVCDRISSEGICAACRKKVRRLNESFCLKCGKPVDDETEEYCSDCMRKRHYFEAGRSLFSYEKEIRHSLYRMKYANRRDYAQIYGKEMAKELGGWIRKMRITVIIPIPLHRSRRRQRGYNQAALLARELGRWTGLPVKEDVLLRIRKTIPLKKLNSHQRRTALRGAFIVQKKLPYGSRVLLVDDIYTTGSTADEAAFCLKKHISCEVFLITAAAGG